MKTRHSLFGLNPFILTSLIIFFGSATLVFGQPRIDGISVDSKPTAETNRTIFVRPDSFGESTIIVGTNKGKVLYAKIKTDVQMFKPLFKPFALMQPTMSLVRDINFLSANGFLLKSDSIYSNDGKSTTWTQLLGPKDLQQTKLITELWGIGFIDNRRACIAGVYLSNNTDRDIEKELLLCSNDITDKNSWKEPEKPKDVKTQQLQLTNIYFDRNQHGWAVGTDGAEGIIWYSDDSGNNWKELKVSIPEPLLNVYGVDEDNVVAVGFNGLIFGKGIHSKNTNPNPPAPINEGDKVEIDGKIGLSIPGIDKITKITKIIGKVKEIKENGMLKIKVSEIMPDILPEAVKNKVKRYYENNDVNQKDVKKVDDDGDTDKNKNPEWGKITVKDSTKPVTATLRNVKLAPNGSDGFIVGDKGTILYTQDGGASWRALNTPPQLATVDLYSMYIDENYCWVVGSKGAIVRIRYKS